MEANRVADLSDGSVLYELGDHLISCKLSHDKRWQLGAFKRDKSKLRDDTLAVLMNEKFMFSVKLGDKYSPKPQCIAVNGRFLFSVHTGKDNNMAAVIAMDNSGNELFKIETSTHLISSAISEFGRYIALSFAGSKNKDDFYAHRLEVINIDTGEVLMSVIKTDFLRYAELSVVEPEGGLFATYNGRTRLVDVTNL
ncbi:TPA: hypothetical protein MNC23_002267 [Citrobacter freundii]|uniref:hypothetical protein n=1 Tax=Citrobacter freundii TaxID=546 RepID=UPI000FD94C26|nr:hypothetical protein [Citrobacter freundii]ELK1247703.1 hypothetical protein [Citrobacter freundii]ELR9591910.1 hypothetical protein [Citrobacter freundii]ELZ3593119.1 hypothetical protein [Citrobacter freundii]EMD6923483.1 hypothetical protein [Citrobacter freundii]MBJ8724845.1 hypothetical protein [Citrobacter freundii]